jgi:hypothetical protein
MCGRHRVWEDTNAVRFSTYYTQILALRGSTLLTIQVPMEPRL